MFTSLHLKYLLKCTLTLTGCTHFTFLKRENGIGLCQLREGRVSKETAFYNKNYKTECGFTAMQWLGLNWTIGCEFDGETFSIENLNVSECARKCSMSSECARYNWKWNGRDGTCYLQHGEGNKSEAYFVNGNFNVCGIVGHTENENIPNFGKYFIPF